MSAATTHATMFAQALGEDEGWVLFRIDTIWLAAHQSQVKRLMDTREFVADPDRPGCWLDPKRHRAAFHLNARLRPCGGEKKRFAIYLESIQGPIGILCDEIQAVGYAAAGRPMPIPDLIAAVSPVADGLLQPEPQRVAVIIDPVMFAMMVDQVYGEIEDE